MKMIMKRKLNKIVVFLLLLTCIVPMTGFSVKAAEYASCWLTVSQTVEATDSEEEPVYRYRLKTLNEGNPMPEDSSEGEYILELEGKDEVEIQIDFTRTGEYRYSFERIVEESNGYVCDENAYTIIVGVKYDNKGQLISETSAIRQSNGMKAKALKFNYTYNPEAAATVDVQGANTTATMATNNNAAGDNQQGNAAGQMADNNPGDGNTQEDLEQLGDEAVPRGLRNTDAWAFANLILAVVTFLGTIILWIAYYIKKKKIEKSHEQEEIGTTEESNFYKSFRILSIVVGAASVVFFFLTEDVTLPIRMTDQYTWIMTVAFFVQLIDMLYIWTKGKGHKEKE